MKMRYITAIAMSAAVMGSEAYGASERRGGGVLELIFGSKAALGDARASAAPAAPRTLQQPNDAAQQVVALAEANASLTEEAARLEADRRRLERTLLELTMAPTPTNIRAVATEQKKRVETQCAALKADLLEKHAALQKDHADLAQDLELDKLADKVDEIQAASTSLATTCETIGRELDKANAAKDTATAQVLQAQLTQKKKEHELVDAKLVLAQQERVKADLDKGIQQTYHSYHVWADFDQACKDKKEGIELLTILCRYGSNLNVARGHYRDELNTKDMIESMYTFDPARFYQFMAGKEASQFWTYVITKHESADADTPMYRFSDVVRTHVKTYATYSAYHGSSHFQDGYLRCAMPSSLR
ncbi:hypothetical protein OAN22_02385 [Alphaproteobacteria bacterium]|nr:hypothetical protein [Alphaproteobacteria bacterium]